VYGVNAQNAMPALNKDIHLSAEFVTLLRAGFYSQILFEGAMAKLESSLLPENYLETAHKAFDKIELWIKDITSNLPIFSTSWNSPETFDAISAMSFLRELKKDLLWLIPQVEDALRLPNLAQEREAVKLLAATCVRSAATRNSYVETLSSIFTKLQARDLAEQVALEVEPSRDYMRVTQIILDTFTSKAAYADELCEKLRSEASLLPSDFRAHIHDANILLNVYAKEFTFELAEIPRDEAQTWIEKRIPAVAAGYWRAYEFTPEDLLEWKSLGITGAPLAANWRRAQFSPQEAIEWIKEGLTPAIAIPWRKAGFEPARVVSMLQRGITDPARAPRYEGSSDEDEEEPQE
jgi:hypothetical protein